MKNWVKIFGMIAFVISLLCASSVLAVEAEVQINGEYIDFTDENGNKVNAQIINSRTMVPLRKIFEVLGCEIEWEPSTKTVTARKEKKEIVLQINNKVAMQKEEGVEKTIVLDTAPVIVNNRTLVPLRFIAESLEEQVGWDASTYTAIIIDYDYFADLIKQKNASLYEILTSNANNTSFTITRNYTDTDDASLNTSATLRGNVLKSDTKSNVTFDFEGNHELITEIAEEGWSHLNYEAQYKENGISIETTSTAMLKMLQLKENSENEFTMERLNLAGSPTDELALAIRHIFQIEESKLTVSTFSKMKSDFDKFLEIFILNGTRNVGSQAKLKNFDYTRFDNIIYDNEMVKALAFLNKTIFNYDISQEELFYDWTNIQYQLNCENHKMVLKITLVNEYNEKIEYIVQYENN